MTDSGSDRPTIPELRIGQGFDVHPFSEDSGRPMVLGGVTFDGPGLAGHSDADPVAHAVTDALLAEAKRALGATFHDCPGFWDWPVTGNLDLLAAFNAAAPLPAPLEALDSGMLKPKTSQLALCDRPASAPLYVSR